MRNLLKLLYFEGVVEINTDEELNQFLEVISFFKIPGFEILLNLNKAGKFSIKTIGVKPCIEYQISKERFSYGEKSDYLKCDYLEFFTVDDITPTSFIEYKNAWKQNSNLKDRIKETTNFIKDSYPCDDLISQVDIEIINRLTEISSN